MTVHIDLNADLGEGFGQWTLGDDDALLEIVTSANVACGFHAGDPTVLRAVCDGAAAKGVSIGAQVGYRDLAGFGRRFIDIAPHDLTQDVIYQIGALEGFARVAGTRVRYVKPHGALYNAIVHHEEQAAAVVEAVLAYDPSLPVLGLPGSAWLRQAEAAGLRTIREAFADRNYTPEGTPSPDGSPPPSSTTPRRSPAGASASRRRGGSPRSTAPRSTRRPGRCACTATPPARSRSPDGSGPRSRTAGSRSVPSPRRPGPPASPDEAPPLR